MNHIGVVSAESGAKDFRRNEKWRSNLVRLSKKWERNINA